jgi:hypothetical protein
VGFTDSRLLNASGQLNLADREAVFERLSPLIADHLGSRQSC